MQEGNESEMMFMFIRRTLPLVLATILLAGSAMAQRGGVEVVRAPGTPGAPDPSAREIRAELAQILQQYPPSLARVLMLDPSLLTNQNYLAPYPALATYLNRHPEIAHNPGFFIGSSGPYGNAEPILRENPQWEDILIGLSLFTVLFTALGVLSWLIRTVIDHRRWLRLTKIQTEVHSKLMDRLTSNEDLLAYIQTPAGKRFLESTPIVTELGPPPVHAPIRRILSSAQLGFLLSFGGLALYFVSPEMERVPDAGPLTVIGPVLGAIATCLGMAFILSAIASYLLSRKLGLLDQPLGSTREAGAPPASPPS